jgi:hypothetical protein
MKKISPKYPWCTGAPRPTLMANLDAQEAIVSYYTAPICRSRCKTAVIKLTGVVRLESRSVNDEENTYLRSGLMRDVIYVKQGARTSEYLLLFHNELTKATAADMEEQPGGDSFMDNLRLFYNSDFDRE